MVSVFFSILEMHIIVVVSYTIPAKGSFEELHPARTSVQHPRRHLLLLGSSSVLYLGEHGVLMG